MKPEEFLQTTLTDIKVKLTEEFDKNFERKAFFNEKWKSTKLRNNRGSLMMRSRKLRGAIQSKITPMGIQFTSSMPYAEIHNKGGEITVTAKMKRFFWAMFYKTSNKVKTTKKGKISKSVTSQRYSQEATQWKALALMKVGQKMKIEQRQFIGHHRNVDRWIRFYISKNMKTYMKEVNKIIHKHNNY